LVVVVLRVLDDGSDPLVDEGHPANATPVVPCTVLDMFGGTGTTAQAALKHGRDAILIELNADYIRLAEQRLAEYLHPANKLAAD
jgi:spermidine synthase